MRPGPPVNYGYDRDRDAAETAAYETDTQMAEGTDTRWRHCDRCNKFSERPMCFRDGVYQPVASVCRRCACDLSAGQHEPPADELAPTLDERIVEGRRKLAEYQRENPESMYWIRKGLRFERHET